jgi:hypothetical protein
VIIVGSMMPAFTASPLSSISYQVRWLLHLPRRGCLGRRGAKGYPFLCKKITLWLAERLPDLLKERAHDQALEESFPASNPLAIA